MKVLIDDQVCKVRVEDIVVWITKDGMKSVVVTCGEDSRVCGGGENEGDGEMELLEKKVIPFFPLCELEQRMGGRSGRRSVLRLLLLIWDWVLHRRPRQSLPLNSPAYIQLLTAILSLPVIFGSTLPSRSRASLMSEPQVYHASDKLTKLEADVLTEYAILADNVKQVRCRV